MSISRLSALETRFQPLVSPRWPASEHTAAVSCQDHPGVLLLRPSAAGATAVPETSTLLSASRRGQSIPPPSPAYTAATPWPSRYHWWPQEPATADASWSGAGRNCRTLDTHSTAGVSHPRPDRAC